MIIENTLYGGKVRLLFDTLKHKYMVNGETIPGATSVLSILNKPALMYWSANCASDYWLDGVKPGKALDELEINALYEGAKKAHTQKKNDSATLGSFVHKFVEQHIKGENPEMPVNDQMRGSAKRFMSWVARHKVKFLSSEQPVFSKKYKYAGTADFICQIDGKLWLGDLKTSNALYPEYFAQVASYLVARVEEFPRERYHGAIIVRVGKDDGDFELAEKTKKELIPYFDLFLNLLASYRSLSGLGMLEKK